MSVHYEAQPAAHVVDKIRAARSEPSPRNVDTVRDHNWDEPCWIIGIGDLRRVDREEHFITLAGPRPRELGGARSSDGIRVEVNFVPGRGHLDRF